MPLPALSAETRLKNIRQAAIQHFDLVVIGGGITGCGIALDAAAQGLKVLLLEKGDFASGTSSKSTKLIHGGLRYLEQFELGLVKEVGKERKILNRLVPHLVRPEPMLLPVGRGAKYGKFLTILAVRIYELLTGVRKAERGRILSRGEILSMEPLLNTEGLTGGVVYTEYQTDDARLTIEVLKTAAAKGALVVNYAKVTSFRCEKGRISGLTFQDGVKMQEYSVTTQLVVNAAGPWVDEVARLDEGQSSPRIQRSKGVHIVLDYKKLPLSQALYFSAADGRMVFAIPREGCTYIGTTDTPFSANPDSVVAEEEDILYLLEALKTAFPSLTISALDVIASWAGLRPLVSSPGKQTKDISRKDELFESGTGLITIAGGKLTGYRVMAERVMARVNKRLGRAGRKLTDTLPLLCSIPDYEGYYKDLTERFGDRYGPNVVELIRRYGSGAFEVLNTADSMKDVSTPESIIRAEAVFCRNYEMVVYPEDFWVRRTFYHQFNPALELEFQSIVSQILR